MLPISGSFNTRGRRVEIRKAEVRFASVDDVVIHKVIAGRPRDLEDVRTMLLKNSSMDVAYIRHWLEESDRSLSEKYWQRFDELRKNTTS